MKSRRKIILRTAEPQPGSADLQVGWFGRGTRIQLNRKMDLELLLFCYFLGSMVLLESILPTSLDALDQGGAPAASKA